MGKIYKYFNKGSYVYCCKKCGTDISSRDDLVSKNFRGKTGEAYLFNKAINIQKDIEKDVNFSTGQHCVRTIYCIVCNLELGCYALKASEKYKQNKVILEKLQLKKSIRG